MGHGRAIVAHPPRSLSMSVTCRSLAATLALVFAVSAARCDESRGSVANVPTSMAGGNSAISAGGGAASTKQAERLREGTKLVDVVGTFQSAGGDSVSFSRD